MKRSLEVITSDTEEEEQEPQQKVARIDKNLLSEVRQRLDESFKKLHADVGVYFKIGNMTFDQKRFTCQLIGLLDNDDTSCVEQANWNALCHKYDLKPEHWNRQVSDMSGAKHILWDIRPKNKRYPIITKSGGRTLKNSHQSVLYMINAKQVFETKPCAGPDCKNKFTKAQSVVLDSTHYKDLLTNTTWTVKTLDDKKHYYCIFCINKPSLNYILFFYELFKRLDCSDSFKNGEESPK